MKKGQRVLATIVLVGAFVLLPGKYSWSQRQKRVDAASAARAETAALKQRLALVNQTKQNRAEIAEKLAALETQIPPTSDVAGLIDAIANEFAVELTWKSGSTVEGAGVVDPSATAAPAAATPGATAPADPAASAAVAPGGSVTGYGFGLEVRGNYDQIAEFLGRLRAMPRVVIIDSVSLRISGQLQASIGGRVFMFSGPALDDASRQLLTQ